MPITLRTTLRNAIMDAITSDVGNAGKLRIYTASYAVMLVEFTLGTPFAGAASGGVLTLTTPATVNASASGTAAIARIYKSDGTTMVIEGLSVGDSSSSADIKLQQTGTTITSGQPAVWDSGTLTQANP